MDTDPFPPLPLTAFPPHRLSQRHVYCVSFPVFHMAITVNVPASEGVEAEVFRTPSRYTMHPLSQPSNSS